MPIALRTALAVLACGLISAGLVWAVKTDSLVRLLMLGLAPLPLFACGLSVGLLACVAAGLTGSVLVTLTMGTTPGAIYLAAAAVPTAVLVRQALRVEWKPDGTRVWHGGGNLLLWLAGLGVAGVLSVVAYTALYQGGLVSAIHERLHVEPAAAAMMARIAPGLIVSLWMTAVVADGAVAEWLLGLTGLALRPPIDIGRLILPQSIGLVLMVAGLAGAILREGTAGIIFLNSAIVLVVPFAFVGLATIHVVAGRRPWGAWAIAGAYVVLLASPALFGWPTLLMFALLLAGLGSLDQVLDFRGLKKPRTEMRRK